MITLLQREPSGSWKFSNANLQEPLRTALSSCSEKCNAIAALLSRMDVNNSNAGEFRVDLAALTGRIRSLNHLVADDKEWVSLEESKREKLWKSSIQIALGVRELKDMHENSSPFQSEDFSSVSSLIDELSQLVGELPKELVPVARKKQSVDKKISKELIEKLYADLQGTFGLQCSEKGKLTLAPEDLNKFPAVSQFLVPLLQMDDPALRVAVTNVLIKIYAEWPELEETLFPLFKIPDSDLVVRIARILNDDRLVIRSHLYQFLDVFFRNFRDSGTPLNKLYIHIMRAVQIEQRDLKVLLLLLENPDERISKAASMITTFYGNDMRLVQADELAYSAALLELLSSNLLHVRKHAFYTLNSRRWMSADPRLKNAILALRNDPDPTLREAAINCHKLYMFSG